MVLVPHSSPDLAAGDGRCRSKAWNRPPSVRRKVKSNTAGWFRERQPRSRSSLLAAKFPTPLSKSEPERSVVGSAEIERGWVWFRGVSGAVRARDREQTHICPGKFRSLDCPPPANSCTLAVGAASFSLSRARALSLSPSLAPPTTPHPHPTPYLSLSFPPYSSLSLSLSLSLCVCVCVCVCARARVCVCVCEHVCVCVC